MFNNEPGLFGGRVRRLDIPVLSLSGEDGDDLLARLEAGEELSADPHRTGGNPVIRATSWRTRRGTGLPIRRSF